MRPGGRLTDFWAAIAERDWARMATLLAPDTVVEWSATGEPIMGRENVVAINAEYPEAGRSRCCGSSRPATS